MTEPYPVETQQAVSLDESRRFLTDSANYAPFDLTRDFRRIHACADPRNESREPTKRIKTAIQTAGGGYGEAHDRAVAQTVISGQLITIENGLREEVAFRGASVLGIHKGCKFLRGIVPVIGEEVEPTDFTKDDLQRTLQRYKIKEEVEPALPKVREGAKRQAEYIGKLVEEEESFEEHLAQVGDQLYPRHANLSKMIGTNEARIYLLNHHPHAGLNRDKKARLRDQGKDIQGYHESRRAAYEDILASYDRLTKDERLYRVATYLMRVSAARTVLGRLQPDTEYYEITQGEHGLLIARQEGP